VLFWHDRAGPAPLPHFSTRTPACSGPWPIR